MRAIVNFALVLATIPAFAAGSLKYENKATEDFVKKLVNDTNAGNPLHVSAIGVAKAYRKNEVAADIKHKDKLLFIEAKVDAVSKDMFGNVVLRLKSDNQFMPSDARLNDRVVVLDGIEKPGKPVTLKMVSSIEAAASINPGSSIALVCQGAGFLMGTVQYKACEVISR